jgi:ABC-type uncharacterized transport system substrate-binding protein
MKRREFIAGIGAAAWPLAAREQQRALPVIGFVSTASAEGVADFTSSFRKGLSEIGYVEGQSVSIEYGWANDQPQRLKGLVADMLRRKIAVLAAPADAALIAKEVTSTIPIIFVAGGAGQIRPCRELESPRWKRYRRNVHNPRTCRQAPPASARTAPQRNEGRFSKRPP